MQAGDLIHRVRIEEDQGETLNALNERVEDWQTIAYRYASIEPLKGIELWTAMQVQADVTHKIKMRCYASLTPKMRLVFAGRIFNIGSIRNIEERREQFEILCKEQV